MRSKKYFITIAILLSVLISNVTTFAYQNPVAVIVNYDDIEENIMISRADGEPDGAEALLYPGDKITGEIELAKVNCAPYVELQADGQTCVVVYNPPSGIWGVTQSMCDAVTSFWSNVENVTTGISRGSGIEHNLIPQPGFDVTLLMSQETRFGWGETTYKNFFVKDNSGKVIFEKDITGVSYIDIVPGSIGVQEGEHYTWGIDSTFDEYKFVILDTQSEKELLSKLAEIDKEKLSADECVLKKVKYVQLLSDIYPEAIDLYWLGLQWLLNLEVLSSNNQREKQMLLQKSHYHLDQEM